MNALLNLTSDQLMVWFGTIWWPFIRLAAFFWILPVYDNPAVAPRAKVMTALFLSFLLSSYVEVVPVDPFSVEGAIVTGEQILFALIMAAAVRMLFDVLALVGLTISMQMGLSMAMMMDPGSGDQVSVLSQLFWVMTVLLFFAFDGHLISLQLMVDSFALWPVGSSLYQLDLPALISLFGWMLGATLTVALPAIIAMLLVNLTFGVASRSAPSMNLFALGFPMALLLGFVCVYLTLYQMGEHFFSLAEYVFALMRQAMG